MPELLDLTPRFSTFYALAQQVTPEVRWALWQQHYNFAAVPPTPDSPALARRLLDGAWDRYRTLPDDLAAEVRRVETQGQHAEQQVTACLAAPVPEYRLVAFVGGFEGNAFTYSSPAPTLCMPIEMTPEWTATIFTHELTHLVHAPLSGSAGGWTRTVAALIVQEGLATRVTEQIHPDAPLEWQVGNAAWLAACTSHRMALIHDAQARLEASDDASLLRFLQPHPEFGQERTAYALGWWVVGHWLETGRSLAELARVTESALPDLVNTQFTAFGTGST